MAFKQMIKITSLTLALSVASSGFKAHAQDSVNFMSDSVTSHDDDDRGPERRPGWGHGPGRGPGRGPGWGPRPGPRPGPQPGPRPGYDSLIPVYRFFDGRQNHFLTLSYQEGIGAGMRYEGVAFQVYSQPRPGRIALYRCYNVGGSDHMVSSAANCETPTYRNEGLYGYVDSQPNFQSRVAIVRFFNPRSGDHLTQYDADLSAYGYVREGVQGYVYQ
jgi:hypothetical protein